MNCFLCDKQIEGEDVQFTLHEGFALFTRQKPNSTHREISHNCKRPEYYEKRRQSARATKLDKALRKAILNPTKRARAELDEQIYDALMAVAKRGGTMDSLRAAERLVELFVGSEPPPEAEPERTTQRGVEVVIRESVAPLASPNVAGAALAGDDSDISQQENEPQKVFDMPVSDSQHQNGVEDFGTVEDRRERERQEYWALEVEAWEKPPARKFLW